METSPYMDSAQSMLGDNEWGRGGREAQCQPTMFPIFKPARTTHIYRKLSTEWMVRHPQLHSPEIARERKQAEGGGVDSRRQEREDGRNGNISYRLWLFQSVLMELFLIVFYF